ncbi:hypothetical protein M8818_007861 [Zalaria obscura]|uniref:Uncharacterized protein n=1 Tax=Zalaria obscura TaxID=2024903 RepID=A0ACC3S2S4_9PEZI
MQATTDFTGSQHTKDRTCIDLFQFCIPNAHTSSTTTPLSSLSMSSPYQQPLKIAIIGGGIGGLFATLCIRHHAQGRPVEIDVYEQASEFKEIGAGVGLGINAARLVHKVGIGEELNKIAGKRDGIWITFRRFDNSEDIVTVPLDDKQTIRQAPVARSDILDLLRHTIEDRKAATLHTKKQCKRVEDHGDSVTIHFADSTTATANLVVACDGIHSNVRNQFVQDKPIYSGQIAYRATIPISQIKDWNFPSYSVAWCAKHKHMLVFPITQNKVLNVVAFVTAGEDKVQDVVESWTSVCDRKDVEKDFEGFDAPVQQIISLMPEKPSKWRLNDREPLNQWSYFDGKVILLGDAAHAMLPHLGAGAGQAMEDGWVLGRTLGEYLHSSDPESLGSLQACADHYQTVRLPRAQRTQRTSRIAGNTYEMQVEDMVNKSYDECLPLMAERTKTRMQWVWEEDLDAAYDKVKQSASGEVKS